MRGNVEWDSEVNSKIHGVVCDIAKAIYESYFEIGKVILWESACHRYL